MSDTLKVALVGGVILLIAGFTAPQSFGPLLAIYAIAIVGTASGKKKSRR